MVGDDLEQRIEELEQRIEKLEDLVDANDTFHSLDRRVDELDEADLDERDRLAEHLAV